MVAQKNLEISHGLHSAEVFAILSIENVLRQMDVGKSFEASNTI